jgi:hypothetical protein
VSTVGAVGTVPKILNPLPLAVVLQYIQYLGGSDRLWLVCEVMQYIQHLGGSDRLWFVCEVMVIVCGLSW